MQLSRDHTIKQKRKCKKGLSRLLERHQWLVRTAGIAVVFGGIFYYYGCSFVFSSNTRAHALLALQSRAHAPGLPNVCSVPRFACVRVWGFGCVHVRLCVFAAWASWSVRACGGVCARVHMCVRVRVSACACVRARWACKPPRRAHINTIHTH